jgi:hypothetical protein
MSTLSNKAKKLSLHTHRWVASRVNDADITTLAPAKKLSWYKRIFINTVVRPQRLTIPLMGPIAFQMIKAGHELGVFEHLNKNEGADFDSLQQSLALQPHALDVLLIGLSTLKIIHKIEDRFYNDPYLVQSLSAGFSDGILLKWIDFMQHLVAPASAHFVESVRQDKAVGLHNTFDGNPQSFYEALSGDERMSYFDKIMKSVTAINQDRVAALPIFSKFSNVLDVGGSTGSMAMAIAKQHPNAHVTVFDFPGVVAIAEKNFVEASLSDRLSIIGGNILEDEIPRGFDCITFCHFMGVFSEEKNIANIQKAYNALEKGAYLCVYTPILNADEDGPISTGLFSAYFLFLANGNGRFYSPDRVKGWMQQCGFSEVEVTTLPANEAVFIGKKN